MNVETTLPLTRHRHERKSSASCTALTLYLDNLAPSGRRSMRSLLQQIAVINDWTGNLEDLPWLTLRYEHVAGIRAALRKANKSPNTINTTLAAIRGVLKAGFLIGHYPAQEWQRIQSIPRTPGKQRSAAGRCLHRKEIDRMLQACQQDGSLQGIRDAAILALLAYAGLRRSEVANLNLADYQGRCGLLQVREGKGNRSRELVLPVITRTYLRRWLHCRGKSLGPLFCQLAKDGKCHPSQRMNAQRIYGILKRRAREAGIATCTPHDLRRTFVTRLLEQGVDFNTTRQLAGHENIQTTVLYDRRHAKTQRQALANLRF
jgi:integrase/recombinase XerD